MRDIPGYEGLYAATSCGKIWSYTSKKFLAQRFDKNGYVRVTLSKGGKLYTRFVHQLVALAYIPNPENKETVNHKDEIKTHNWVGNLEWMTRKENMQYGTRMERAWITRKKNGHFPNCAKKKVYCVELDREFESGMAAAKELILDSSGISKACRGILKTCGGYHWRFVKEGEAANETN